MPPGTRARIVGDLTRPRMLVLLCEENPAMHRLMRERLAAAGARVVPCARAADALDRYGALGPAWVVLSLLAKRVELPAFAVEGFLVDGTAVWIATLVLALRAPLPTRGQRIA